jgi:hypothetical protein
MKSHRKLASAIDEASKQYKSIYLIYFMLDILMKQVTIGPASVHLFMYGAIDYLITLADNL